MESGAIQLPHPSKEVSYTRGMSEDRVREVRNRETHQRLVPPLDAMRVLGYHFLK